MMNVMREKRKTDALVVLLLFGVFAVCVLSVLLTGADAYQRLSERDRVSYDQRTVTQYLSMRVRQADRLGGVETEMFESCPALILKEEYDGVVYETRVYCYDGYIRELFTGEDSDLLPEDGEKILPAQSLLAEQEGSTLVLRVMTENEAWQELRLTFRSREGAAS